MKPFMRLETSRPSLFHTRLARTFSAMRYPNYRLWFFGQLISLTGSWTQAAAQGYLLYEMTQSAAFLGYLGFANGAPAWLFTLYAGVIADRLPRRTLIVIIQTAFLIIAFLTAGLIFSGAIQPWHILALSALTGIANAFDAPVRQAFVANLVEREDLTNAIALNATMFNSAVVIGPAIGGLVYAVFGPGWCFFINGCTYLAVIGALLLMQLEPSPPRGAPKSVFADVVEGLKYVGSQPLIKLLIAGLAFASLFGFGAISISPAWAVNVLGGDVRTNSLLLSARGVGSVSGALFVAALAYRPIKGRLWMYAALVPPLALVLFGLARQLPHSLAALILFGQGQMIFLNTTNALVQNQVTNELRGRVMSLYTLVMFGCFPLGSLLAGHLAQWFGEPVAVFSGAAFLMVFALLIQSRRKMLDALP
jgi:predicted MFS family arabinose efflux permease